MMGDLQVHLTTVCWVFSSFWPKTAWSLCPTLPIQLISPSDFFVCFPGWKKLLKWKCFANVEEVKQKIVEALKGIKINEFKNCFEQWKKMSLKVYCIKWRVLWRWLKFKHVKINTQYFINKFCFLSLLLCFGFCKSQSNVVRQETWIRHSDYLKRWIKWSEFAKWHAYILPQKQDNWKIELICSTNN